MEPCIKTKDLNALVSGATTELRRLQTAVARLGDCATRSAAPATPGPVLQDGALAGTIQWNDTSGERSALVAWLDIKSTVAPDPSGPLDCHSIDPTLSDTFCHGSPGIRCKEMVKSYPNDCAMNKGGTTYECQLHYTEMGMDIAGKKTMKPGGGSSDNPRSLVWVKHGPDGTDEFVMKDRESGEVLRGYALRRLPAGRTGQYQYRLLTPKNTHNQEWPVVECSEERKENGPMFGWNGTGRGMPPPMPVPFYANKLTYLDSANRLVGPLSLLRLADVGTEATTPPMPETWPDNPIWNKALWWVPPASIYRSTGSYPHAPDTTNGEDIIDAQGEKIGIRITNTFTTYNDKKMIQTINYQWEATGIPPRKRSIQYEGADILTSEGYVLSADDLKAGRYITPADEGGGVLTNPTVIGRIGLPR